MILNFSAYKDVTTLETLTYADPKLDAAGAPVKDAQGNPVTLPKTTHTQTLAMGTGRFAGGHQDAGHQRRRLFQCQFGSSL